jgi:signal transduction histidine kinase
VEIKISDNGEGIAKENLPNIFKSFFTTKLPSKGTGLGLSISKAIIKRHFGEINVKSTLQEGTTFSIFLPLNFKEI